MNSNDDSQRLQCLEVLVDELLKDIPTEEVVKSHMERVGLEYQTDPVERLNSVLEALQFQTPTLHFKGRT